MEKDPAALDTGGHNVMIAIITSPDRFRTQPKWEMSVYGNHWDNYWNQSN